jgi:hypothetical protein
VGQEQAGRPGTDDPDLSALPDSHEAITRFPLETPTCVQVVLEKPTPRSILDTSRVNPMSFPLHRFPLTL